MLSLSLALPLLLLPPLLPHPPLAFVPVPAWVFRLELVSGILGDLRGVSSNSHS